MGMSDSLRQHPKCIILIAIIAALVIFVITFTVTGFLVYRQADTATTSENNGQMPSVTTTDQTAALNYAQEAADLVATDVDKTNGEQVIRSAIRAYELNPTATTAAQVSNYAEFYGLTDIRDQYWQIAESLGAKTAESTGGRG